MNYFWLAWIILTASWLFCGLKVDYPPSVDQISRWDFLNFDLLRILSFLILIIGLSLIYRQLGKIKKIWLTVMLTSPLLLWSIFLEPINCIKLLIVGIGINLGKYGKILSIVILIVVNILISGEKTGLLRALDTKNLDLNINEKFFHEDMIEDGIHFPLIMRRIADNKITYLGRNVAKEFLSYWNLERWFFQEVAPDSQKGLPMLFWPAMILMLVGLYYYKNFSNLVSFLFLVGYIDFLFNPKNDINRWVMTLPFLSSIVSYGLYLIRKKLVFLFPLLFLFFYGWQSFLFDFSIRPDYWLDNRPILYKHVFSTLPTESYTNFVVTDFYGVAKKYCLYFIKEQCDSRFLFGSFNKGPFEADKIYIGFEGEFLGPDYSDNFNDDSLEKIKAMNFEVLDSVKMRDKIAYKYGQLLIIAKKL